MDKSSEAFRTITEVAENLDLPQHVLRFWETRFSQIKPLKRAGGRRYYRPEDVQLITAIRRLLYDEGFTIRGVQRLLREKGAKAITAGAVPPFGGRDNGGSAASTGEGEIEFRRRNIARPKWRGAASRRERRSRAARLRVGSAGCGPRPHGA